jgi:hypothetical protein
MFGAQRWWRRIERVKQDDFQRTSERHLAAQELVELYAQTLLIAGGLSLVALAAGLLGSEISGRAQDRADLRQLDAAGRQASQTEVGQVRSVVGVEQHVGRLDVAMDDSLLMGGVQRICQAADNPSGTAGLERAVIDGVRKRSAGDESRRDVRSVAVDAGFINCDDVWVMTLGCGLCLSKEAADGLFVALKLGVGNLECDVAIEGWVDRSINRSAGAGAESLLEKEAADPLRELRV